MLRPAGRGTRRLRVKLPRVREDDGCPEGTTDFIAVLHSRAMANTYLLALRLTATTDVVHEKSGIWLSQQQQYVSGTIRLSMMCLIYQVVVTTCRVCEVALLTRMRKFFRSVNSLKFHRFQAFCCRFPLPHHDNLVDLAAGCSIINLLIVTKNISVLSIILSVT